MASFKTEGISNLIASLSRTEIQVSANADAALNAGADVLVNAMQKEAKETFTSDRSTGGLAKAVKKTKPKESEYGKYIDVTLNGKNSSGESYNKIGFVLNYGRSNMPARPWVTAARKKSEQSVQEAMAAAWSNSND